MNLVASTNPRPSLSVVIPTYNRGHCLESSVGSAMAPADIADEIVVVDDASQDDTQSRIAALAREAACPVRYVRMPVNRGVSAARNLGCVEAAGTHVVFLDSDDRLLSGALERFRIVLAGRPDVDMVIGGRLTILPGGRRRARIPKALASEAWENFSAELTGARPTPGIGSSAIRRATALKFPFPESLPIAEDMVFFARLLLHCQCVCLADLQVEIDQTRHHVLKYPDRLFSHQKQAFTLAMEGIPESDRLAQLRHEVEPLVWLRTFREYHRSGMDRTARPYYFAALRRYPAMALRLTHLRKLMRGIFGLRHPAA